jgi:hypothetical protein
MDYELIFWVVAPFVLMGIIIGRMYLQARRSQQKADWEREHADDFNKDIWED